VVSVESRGQLRELLKGRNSGGVFLTTIHKFTEDTELLTERANVICISDEAHCSQVNLDQKVTVTEEGVKRTFGFAKYLHDSLPNATYVGFTGTPIDATLDVFGPVDTIYIDKPIQRHNLIQTISRVNRRFEGKGKGLVVDYIGIKTQMNLALAHYSKADKANIEEVGQSIVVVKDHLDLLNRLFHSFDTNPYFSGSPVAQLQCLNRAAEFAQITEKVEKRFMGLVKRMKAAYDICSGSDAFLDAERDHIHFYLAVRSIVAKLTKGEAPDTAQMNAKVRKMIAEALQSDGVEEIFKLGEDGATEIDIFGGDYLAKIGKIKLPHTKIKLLQQLLKRAIEEFKKINKIKVVDFSEQFQALVKKYNERKEEDVLVSNVLEDFSDEIIDLFQALKMEKESFGELGIDFEEKAFYDILKALAIKYDFDYPDDKLLDLAKAVKTVVDDKAKYTDWSQRADIKAELKVDLIILLAEYGYPPVDRDEVYKEIFEQAENFKKYQMA
jgi:type I restriction enzyme R subunit